MKKLIICLLLVVPLVANGQISFQKVDKSPKLTPTKHEYCIGSMGNGQTANLT